MCNIGKIRTEENSLLARRCRAYFNGPNPSIQSEGIELKAILTKSRAITIKLFDKIKQYAIYYTP